MKYEITYENNGHVDSVFVYADTTIEALCTFREDWEAWGDIGFAQQTSVDS